MYRLLSVVVLLSLGCGVLEDDSKASQKFNNAVPANNSGPPLNNPDPEDLWAVYGTRGSTDGLAKSSGGHAFCAFGDIRTDDLGQTSDTNVPPGTWDLVVDDREGRCGDDAETAIWRLMNCERITQEIAPIACDQRLVWLGRAHSQDMINLNYFDHNNPAGQTPFDRMGTRGIDFRRAGENIAINSDTEDAHLRWMDSPGHRGNMMGNYEYAGCGIVENHLTTPFVR